MANKNKNQCPENKPEIQCKLVMLGESSIGKSSIIQRFVKDQFYDYKESTVGAAFYTKIMDMNDVIVKFELWDTAGQERYHSLAPMYYRAAQAAIVVYDITSQDTFERAKGWVKELQRQAPPDIVIALAGNKLDLDMMRSVEAEESKMYAYSNGLLFMETSAKTNDNISEIFKVIAKQLPRNKKTLSNNGYRITEPSKNNYGINNCCQ